jgi:CubicO group peptidase (beta-lactamase class C family)
MKIRTRSTLLSTVALAAVAAAVAVPGTAQAEFGIGAPQANVTKMHESVLDQIQGRTFGWQLAIAQNGQLKVTASDGTAVSQADNNGNWVSMKPTQRMELASVTKNITAVATMKLLRRNGLTVESKVWPYLPPAWDESKFKAVKFKHLLTHTSGINQAITAMPAAQRPKDNTWASMRIVVENGTTVDSQRQYKNANFALLRVIDAKLWKLSGGSGFGPVAAWNHTKYLLDFDRKHIFEPAGLHNIGCIPSSTTTGVRSYALNSNQTSNGKVFGTNSDECAGARGIALSSVQLLQYLAHLRHGSIINPADLATMDQLRAGWNEDSNGGDGGQSGAPDGVADNALSPGAYWHGGDLFGSNGRELHTCAMTFDDGTEATLLINSAIGAADPGEGTTQCGILLRAWIAAKS